MTGLWREWGGEAPAASGEKLLAVFVGASWDRWSTALRDVLDDPGVREAASAFERLAVDAEARPDLALRLAPMGFPVLAVLTPAGHPLVATGYAPQRTIRELLNGAALQWHLRAPAITDAANRSSAAAREMSAMLPSRRPADESFIAAAVESLVESGEPAAGGWPESPRLLRAPSLRLLALRPALPGARALLESALDSLQSAFAGGFFHLSDAPDWSAPDGLERPAELAELMEAFTCAASTLSRTDYADTARRIAARLDALRDPRGLMPCAVSPGHSHSLTAHASFSAAANLSFAPLLRDPATDLFRRAPEAPPPFHLIDQAAALEAFSRRDPAAAAALADVVQAAFWDETAAAFRDRSATPSTLAPLDTPQFPADENALAARALARLGGRHRALAARCLSSFADAFLGQGHAAAPLAVAAATLDHPPTLT